MTADTLRARRGLGPKSNWLLRKVGPGRLAESSHPPDTLIEGFSERHICEESNPEKNRSPQPDADRHLGNVGPLRSRTSDAPL